MPTKVRVTLFSIYLRKWTNASSFTVLPSQTRLWEGAEATKVSELVSHKRWHEHFSPLFASDCMLWGLWEKWSCQDVCLLCEYNKNSITDHFEKVKCIIVPLTIQRLDSLTLSVDLLKTDCSAELAAKIYTGAAWDPEWGWASACQPRAQGWVGKCASWCCKWMHKVGWVLLQNSF